MDDEILKTVESMLGKNIKIVDCEKTSSIREEEILLINGIPVQLDGDEGEAIKTALMTGQVPSCHLLNQLLYRAGILKKPVHLETSISVKSTMVTKEEVTVARDGMILDERFNETKEDNYYSSSCNEIWEPILDTANKEIDNNKLSNTIIKTTTNNILPSSSSLPITTTVASTNNIPIRTNSNTNNCDNLLLKTNCDDKNSTIINNKNHTERILPTSSSSSSLSTTTATSSIEKKIFSENHSIIENLNNHTKSTITPSLSLSSDSNCCSVAGTSTSSCCYSPIPLNNNDSISNNKKYNNSNSIYTTTNNSTYSINNLLNDKYKEEKYNSNVLSYDSGHDGLFNSISQTIYQNGIIDDYNKLNQLKIVDDNTPITTTISSTTGINNSISSSSCYDFISSDEADFINSSSASSSNKPTIFGTVASDQCPKDNINRRGLPQTVASCSSQISITNSTTNKITDKNFHQQQQILNNDKYQNEKDFTTENNDNSLVYRDGNLISGSLDALIQHMVPTNDYYPDRSYLFAFLLSARLFIRPYELLAKICQLCNEQQNINNYNILNKESQQQCPAPTKSINNITIIDNLRKFAQHFIQLLAEWIDTFPYDFRDERLMQHVRSMTHKLINIDANLRKDVSIILQNLLQRLTILEKYEEYLQTISGNNTSLTSTISGACSSGTSGGINNRSFIGNNLNDSSITPSLSTTTTTTIPTATTQTKPISTNLLSNISTTASTISSSSTSSLSGTTTSTLTTFCGVTTQSQQQSQQNSIDIIELCPNPTLLAHQLTHIELERLSYIGPEEFVQAFAKENPNLEQSISDMKKTRNLESYVQWFNRLSYFVATEIVRHPKKKQRVRVVEYWIETGRECFNIGNFNSLMAIIAGLNMSPISRLKKTWAKVQTAKFSVLEHQMDPSSNFNSYRSTLKAAMWRSAGATDERERIVIPFFSLLVKDLYFLNEGCSNRLPNGHINFEKFWQLAKQVTEFIAWKQVTCPFDKLLKVIVFLQTNHILNENTLAIASFECEPPENNLEKERYKTLKLEQQQQQQH